LGSFSTPTGINARGMVSGYSEVAGHTHAFVWTRQDIRDLGTLAGDDSLAVDLNDRGVVTGSRTAAFVWRPGTGMTEVGGPREDTTLTAISARGQAVRWASSHTPPFEKRVILWSSRTGRRDLATLEPGAIAFPSDINVRGRAVGVAEGADGVSRATLWRP
jgi:probable HAF family extracellular repeat protein